MEGKKQENKSRHLTESRATLGPKNVYIDMSRYSQCSRAHASAAGLRSILGDEAHASRSLSHPSWLRICNFRASKVSSLTNRVSDCDMQHMQHMLMVPSMKKLVALASSHWPSPLPTAFPKLPNIGRISTGCGLRKVVKLWCNKTWWNMTKHQEHRRDKTCRCKKKHLVVSNLNGSKQQSVTIECS